MNFLRPLQYCLTCVCLLEPSLSSGVKESANQRVGALKVGYRSCVSERLVLSVVCHSWKALSLHEADKVFEEKGWKSLKPSCLGTSRRTGNRIAPIDSHYTS